ncbi:MAG: Gfo/Idh/MocA family oxidoreductase [Planctomycetota bacterium]
MSQAKLRVAVIGVGHLGRFHAKIYDENPRAELVGVVDASMERAKAIAAEAHTQAFSRVEDLPDDIDCVSIAVPTVNHAEVAVPQLLRGRSCLIEKPLAGTLADADRILEAAKRGKAQVAVGHVERFQPGLKRVRELGLRPKFIECHRLAPFSFRSQDIGVVHDLMIHDLDLVLDMVDSELVSLDAAGGAILTDNEDVASVRLVFANGARANVTASRASLQPMRRFRMFSSESYVSLDFQKNYGLLVRKGPKWEEGRLDLRRLDPAELAKRPDFLTKDLLEVIELELAGEQRPLQAELDSFLRAIAEGREVEVSGEDGRRALALADRIAAEIRAQAW